MVVEDWMTPAQPSVDTAVQVWMLYMLNIIICILELALCQSIAQVTVNDGDFGKNDCDSEKDGGSEKGYMSRRHQMMLLHEFWGKTDKITLTL